MAEMQLYMILGISGIFVLVIGSILWNQIRQARKGSSLSESAHGSPSSFDAETKTKMLFRLDKRETQLRRERILEGGTLPELSELIIYSPVKDEKIDSPEVDIRGKVAIKSIVWVNCQAAFVDVDGSFIGSVPLTRGKNDLEIVVIGPYGKSIYTSFDINCTSKEAPNLPAGTKILLPNIGLDIHSDSRTESYIANSESVASEDGVPSMKYASPPSDPIIVSESEIDPSVLAALKGDPIADTPIDIPDIPDLGIIEAAEETMQIPDIPDILGDDSVDEVQIPDIPNIPDVDKDEVNEESAVSEDSKAIDESVKIIEETMKIEEESEKPDSQFPLDKMLPVQPGDNKKVVEEEEEEKIELSEFQPLHQDIVGFQELTVVTTHQKLKDERSTEILQYSGLISREDGEEIKILKIEKRIEKIDNRWFSTLGIANLTDAELSLIEISEFISSTFKIKDMLPVNVLEPIVNTLPEGVKITWTINDMKPQMKLFITYNEDVNPLELISEEQKTPKIAIRR